MSQYMIPPPPMKMTTPLLATLLGMMVSVGSAFTLDAIGYEGDMLARDPFSVFVPGYGEIVFEAGPDSSLVVSSAFENDNCSAGPSLCFDPNESVKIIFDDAEPSNLDSEFSGRSADESVVAEKTVFTPQPVGGPRRIQVNLAGHGGVNWHTVPEPASVMLGLIGSLLWMLHRRR